MPRRWPRTWCVASNGNNSWREWIASWNIWWSRSFFAYGSNYCQPPHYLGLCGRKKGTAWSHLLWHPWRRPLGRTLGRASYGMGSTSWMYIRTKMLDPIEGTPLPVATCVYIFSYFMDNSKLILWKSRRYFQKSIILGGLYKSIHFSISLLWKKKNKITKEKKRIKKGKKTFKIIINLLWRQPVWAANNASSTRGHVNSYFKC